MNASRQHQVHHTYSTRDIFCKKWTRKQCLEKNNKQKNAIFISVWKTSFFVYWTLVSTGCNTTYRCIIDSGQIKIFHQPGFSLKLRGFSLLNSYHFGGQKRSCEVSPETHLLPIRWHCHLGEMPGIIQSFKRNPWVPWNWIHIRGITINMV